MDRIAAFITAVAATGFTVDLARDLSRRLRPHTAAYTTGMAMFAVASWALWVGLAFGWTGAAYRTFFLFGAILNIPFLALGSMYLVIGRRSGTVMLFLVAALDAISITLTTTAPFTEALPTRAVPYQVFAPPSTFGPRLLAAVSSGAAALLLAALGIISIFRFWRANRNLIAGNALIVAGTFAAAGGGTFLAVGRTAVFAFTLLATVTLIWAGYRVTKGARRAAAPAT